MCNIIPSASTRKIYPTISCIVSIVNNPPWMYTLNTKFLGNNFTLQIMFFLRVLFGQIVHFFSLNHKNSWFCEKQFFILTWHKDFKLADSRLNLLRSSCRFNIPIPSSNSLFNTVVSRKLWNDYRLRFYLLMRYIAMNLTVATSQLIKIK